LARCCDDRAGCRCLAAGTVRSPAAKPTTGQALEGIVDKTIDAAKTLPFPTLLVVLGFFLVLPDSGWMTISAGG
jgi:hypothetical protein